MSALAVAAIMSLAVLPECGAGQGVLPERMAAVAMVESDGDPLAIGVNGDHPTTLHPASKDAAVATARALLGQGKSIDLGLTQINSANLGHDGLTVETAFDACASLRAGAAHLAADFEAAWRAAHSRYNTGDLQRGIANGYVHRWNWWPAVSLLPSTWARRRQRPTVSRHPAVLWTRMRRPPGMCGRPTTTRPATIRRCSCWPGR